ncbi:hypothetical protein [Salipiger bermudensis]|uniref:Uncharacterized protein n=1 Tax=Salipiger bermudensis (strain DSM 26914 / JCM 13377 / KCTC 12554 / HTCC2601) TaxID=314265 RepID=Q0FLK0_SALBH|nr:hypothetical protein [Salipiger bermudensis]EAU45098.1 hypothetical protein R2601_22966 [Salipiger bermudensis HTCC2601]
MTFSTWIDTFAAEKGLDLERLIEVEGPSGTNFMPAEIVIEAMKSAPASEQRQLRATIVRLDFAAAPIEPFLDHLAQALAI